jgi:hypothetical protein
LGRDFHSLAKNIPPESFQLVFLAQNLVRTIQRIEFLAFESKSLPKKSGSMVSKF